MKPKKTKPPLVAAEPVPDHTYPVRFECSNCGANWSCDIIQGWRVDYSYGDGGMVAENIADNEEYSLIICPVCHVKRDVKRGFTTPNASYPADSRDDLD
jgi:hypothetical protein